MTSTYKTPAVSDEWANCRETDMAVAVAIHAIATDTRTADAIWEAPTSGEWDQVCEAVAQYIAGGDFDESEDGYFWGSEVIPAA